MDTTTVDVAETEVVAVEGEEQEMTEGAVDTNGKVPNPRAGVCKGTVWIHGRPGRVKLEGGWPSTKARRAVAGVKPPKLTKSSWMPSWERGVVVSGHT